MATLGSALHQMISERDALAAEVNRLQGAIRQHRDERGDDRCWMDDELLYAILPEGYTPPPRDAAVELANCQRYIASRHHPCTEYVSPQRRIEELERWLADYTAARCHHLLSERGVPDSVPDGDGLPSLDDRLAGLLDERDRLRDLVAAKEAARLALAEHAELLDRNWETVHEAALAPIRAAAGKETVPEIVVEISRLRQGLTAAQTVAESLAQRVAAQSEMLSRRAEK